VTTRGPARGWSPRAAIGEGVRSALAGRRISAVVVVLVVGLGGLVGAVDAIAVARLIDQEQQFLAAGGDVVVAQNKQSGVPVLACDQIGATTGVTSAALTVRDPAVVSAAPGADVGIVAATPGIWALLRIEPVGLGAVVPINLASRLGLRSGDWIVLRPAPGTTGDGLSQDPVRVTVADTAVLGDEYGGLLLPSLTSPGTAADACVVRARAADLPAVRAALPAALATGSGTTVVLDRLITGEFAADYRTAYRQRTLRIAWLGTGVLLGLVALLIAWLRRTTDALYTAMGADLAARVLVRGSEWSLLNVVGTLWGITLGVALAVAADAPFAIALQYVTRHATASTLLATAIVLTAQLRRPRSLLADLKDR
jgi:hypothetical protein